MQALCTVTLLSRVFQLLMRITFAFLDQFPILSVIQLPFETRSLKQTVSSDASSPLAVERLRPFQLLERHLSDRSATTDDA